MRHEFQNQDHRPTYERDHLHSIFLVLAVVLAIVLFFMFGPGKNACHTASEKPATNRAFILLPST